MSASRLISKLSQSGATFVTAVADTLNQFMKYNAGTAKSVGGTANAVTFQIDVTTGLTAYEDGMKVSIIPIATNTGAMTFEIPGFGLGTKAAVNSDGQAFSGGEIVLDTAYNFTFWGSEDHWRLDGGSSASSTGGAYPYAYVKAFTTVGAWSFTAPWDCDVLVSCIGPGGGGGSGDGNFRCSGGGGGGHAKRSITMEIGETISGNIGTGGIATTDAVGSAGDSTTCTGTMFTPSLVAASGQGGNRVPSASVATGADGGASTGGDENYSGGGSADASTGPSSQKTAGGCFGLNADGNSSTNSSAIPVLENSSLFTVPPFDANGIESGSGNTSANGSGTDAGPGCGGGGGDPGKPGGNGFVLLWYSGDKSA